MQEDTGTANVLRAILPTKSCKVFYTSGRRDSLFRLTAHLISISAWTFSVRVENVLQMVLKCFWQQMMHTSYIYTYKHIHTYSQI